MRAELELITASAPIHATSADIDKQQTTESMTTDNGQ
jgi:hypothetical protein